jgi:hypothetical protein
MNVTFIIALSMVGFVVFVATTRGDITQASLHKAWKATMVLTEKEKMDEDDVSVHGPSTEMREGLVVEMLVV